MYAPQPLPTPTRRPTPKRSRSRSVQPLNRSPRATHRDVVQELSAKLLVNLTLTAIALVYLGRLVNYNLTQETKLERLKAEVAAVDQRVDLLQQEFAVRFDTHQTQQLVRQQRHRVSPGQMQVIWTAPPNTVLEEMDAEGGAPEAPAGIPSPPDQNSPEASVVSAAPQ
jgi:hypothetical protein